MGPHNMNAIKQKLLAATGLAILASILITSNGMAHAYMLRSDPADGSILKEPPEEIRIWFDEPISDRFSSVQLFDVDSQPIEVVGIQRDLSDPTLLVISVPELETGVYSILWKILSEVDGHYNQGLLVFGVGEEANLGSASVAPIDESTPSGLEVLFRWLNLLMLSGLIGGIAMLQLVLGPAWSQAKNSAIPFSVFQFVSNRLLNLAFLCGVSAIIIGVGLLLWQTITLSESTADQVSFASVIGQILFQTRWGTIWMTRQALLICVCTSVYFIDQRQKDVVNETLLNWSQKDGLLLITFFLALITVQALSSHAAGLVTENIALTIVSDGLHLLGAVLWMGGLLSVGIVLLPLIRTQREEIGYLVQLGWRPFSKVAGFSIGLLIATGLYNTGLQVASIDALLSTLYGKAVLVKLTLLLGIGYFGLFNTSLLHPVLLNPMRKLFGTRNGWSPLEINRLPRHILTKGVLSLFVLLVTGLITAAPSPRSSTYSVDPEDIPSALSQNVDDLVVTLNTKPNRPGQNVFTVFAASTRKPPPQEIARVILRFIYLDQDIGRQSVTLDEVEPGRFLLGGNYLRLAGNWQIDVVVRRKGMRDSVAHFDWVVAPPGSAPPVIVSKAPLAATLSLIAAIMLMLIPFHSVLVAWVRREKNYRKLPRFKRKKIYKLETSQ